MNETNKLECLSLVSFFQPREMQHYILLSLFVGFEENEMLWI
jgi:hypothetical protein